ncbi:hypothetical protein CRUP_020427 [Coryphaenoides rupestris]|nr:hypothetical protein CRUP_020427 [Coryphaenoides rupestris]
MCTGGVAGWSYFFSDNTMNWTSARAYCRDSYTDMVAIQNQEEIAHLNSWLPRKPKYYWIGIRKENNMWTWVGTNKTLTSEATNWAVGEPNNLRNGIEDCVEMYVKRDREAGKWNDERCDNAKTALCYAAACKDDSCMHGECVETINSHVCQCFEGFYGDKCEHVVQCDPDEVVAPAQASVDCSHIPHGAFAYGSRCDFSCEEGYRLSHPNSMRCTGAGSWSESPTCELVQCEELSPLRHGTFECEHPLGNSSYKSSCVFSCAEGYDMLRSRSDTLLCGASGRWNDSVPICAAVQCPALSEMEMDNMTVQCDGDTKDRFSYGRSCSFTCSRGYRMRGAHTTTCTAAATWSEVVPSCERVTCPEPEGDASALTWCSDPLDRLQPGSTCSLTCKDGFDIQWAPVIQCTEDGTWNASVPTCKAVTCDRGEVHSAPEQHAIVQCSHTHGQFAYRTVCEYSCEEGYQLSDQSQNIVECTAAGTWSQQPPLCEPVQCSPPAAPEWGQINCQQPSAAYPQGSICTFNCSDGYDHQGPLTTKCTQSGQWSSPLPTCTAIRCPVLDAPLDGALNCTHVDPTHAAQCSFACNQGYTLHGQQVVTCGLHGNWTAETPVCQAVPQSLMSPTAMGLVGGGAVSLSGLSLAIWLLKRLRTLKERKFSLKTHHSITKTASTASSRRQAIAGYLAGRAHSWTYHNDAEPMNWTQARQWCQTNYTDMVVIQSQRENEHVVSFLPNRTGSPYYWIGITKSQKSDPWTWVGNNSTWIGEGSWATNEPNNNHSTEFCVEIYVNHNKERGKWNDEKCSNLKYPVCYKDLSPRGGGARAWMYHYSTDPARTWSSARAWCQQHYTDMVAIQNQAEVEYLNELLPFNPSYYWIGIRKVAGVWTWVGTNRSLTAEAESWATGEPNNDREDCVEMYIRRAKDTAKWNDERCEKTKGTGSCGVHADCVEAIGSFRCQCHPGFLSPACEEAWRAQHGSNVKLPDTGTTRPLCAKCPALNRTSDRLFMNCSHPIAPSSFKSTCEFSCEEGFELASRQSWTECDHAGKWTADVPTCSVIVCAPISPPAAANMTCVDSLAPFSFGSSCSFTCLEGYTLASDPSTLACLASGEWSQRRPTCTVVQCSGLKVPTHAAMRCQDPIANSSYGSICTVRCEEGFNLIGSNITQCSARGRWSRELPVCQALQCRALSAPPHGSLSCSDPHGAFSFSSRCALTCDEGFLANGTTHTECSSLGAWSQEVPRCLALQCRTLSAPPHGSLSCSDPHGAFSFSSRCALTCDEGFMANGTTHTECSSLGAWSQEVPRCLALQCRALSAPPHGSLSCSDPHGAFSFSSRCALTCDEGFLANGTTHTECSSLGAWSQEVPRCLALQCRTLSAPPHGSLSCSDPHGAFSFSSRCALTCDEGFLANGTTHTECSSLGAWSQEVPRCLARHCPLLANAPHHGWMNCSHPHLAFSYGSHCDLGCSEGFWLRGSSRIDCNTSGGWSEEMPTCQVVQCQADWPAGLPAQRLSLNCSHPLGNFSFSSRCRFSCEVGYSMNGTAELLCSADGLWSSDVPTCAVEGMPLWSAMLLYSGGSAVGLLVVLATVGLGLLVTRRFRKKGIMDSFWEEREPSF